MAGRGAIRESDVSKALALVAPDITFVFADDGDGTVRDDERTIRLRNVSPTEWQALAKAVVAHGITVRLLFSPGHPFYGVSAAARRSAPSRTRRPVVET